MHTIRKTGITIAILNIPQAMAYASLAGVPAVVGLYTSFLPPLLYAIFGTSKHVSLGMFAVIALMVGNVEQKHGASLNWHQNSSAFTPDNNVNDLQSVQLVACLTFAVGIVLAIMALCQFHIISVYLTDPLIGGFTTAAAFHVLWSQIPKMFALKLATRNGLFKLFYIIYDFFGQIKNTNLPDLTLTIVCLIFLYVGKIYINPLVAKKCPVPIPFDLIVEVRALAMCQMIASFLFCMPASGGLSRSTLNAQLGTKSQISSIVAASLMLTVILWFGPLLYDLPTSVLSAIVAIALRPMFRQFLQLQQLWKTSIYDFLIWIVTFMVTIVWDVSEGLICAIGFALLTVIIRVQYPQTAQQAKIGDTDVYRDYHRYVSQSIIPHVLIYRFNAPLLFLNCDLFISRGIELVEKTNAELNGLKDSKKELHTKFLILESAAITNLDNMGAEALKKFVVGLKKTFNVQLLVASPTAQFQQMCYACEIYAVIPKSMFFPTIHDAILYTSEEHAIEKDGEVIHI
uniref:STAS domain-containing protein n=1 Tax=Acrobeloides nanus TaxID=290746 RepID=A0A914C1E7_9BILA